LPFHSTSGKMSGPKHAARRWTPGDDDKLRDMLDVGKTAEEIAVEIDRTHFAIYARLQRLYRRRTRKVRLVEARAKGKEMSVLRARPWISHEDIVLQELAAAGKYAAAIAAEMNRSEAAIRSHAALLNLMLAKGKREPIVKK
jgi:C4-dicarboxylate-specific signal transduction histidine kinase